jgi:Rrf2 family transcriptional regulator, iron-sulfur cluster assembly transcription factor
MLYSKYCEYVIKALSYLSHHSSEDHYVLVREISERTKIPYHFLSKIFQDLNSTNWVISKKGRNGGFTFSTDCKRLTLLDIIKWSDGPDTLNQCVLGMRDCGHDHRCSLHRKCSTLRNTITDFFSNMTVYDVTEIGLEEYILSPDEIKFTN